MSGRPSVSLLAPLSIAFNALMWGLSWWPLHLLQARGLHPLWSTVTMYLVPVAGVLLLRPQAARELLHTPLLWGLLLASGLTNICFNWAVTIGDVIRAVLLFYLMPVWAALLAWWWLGERPTLGVVVRIGLALTGVALVLQPAGQPLSQWQFPWPRDLADVLALTGGLCFAATNVLLGMTRRSSPLARVLSMFTGGCLLGGLVAGAAAAWGLLGVTPLPPWQWGWVGLALLCSLGFVISNSALQYGSARLSSHTLSLIMLLEVLFAAVSSSLMGAAHLTQQLMVGGALVMAAAVLAAVQSH